MSKSDCFVVIAHTTKRNSPMTMKSLIDPETGLRRNYILNDGLFLEFSKSSNTPSSWFVNDQVIQDGSLYMATPIHPLFLCIPFLQKADNSKYMIPEDIFTSPDYPDVSCLYTNKSVKRLLKEICETKEFSGGSDDDCFLRYSQDKCIQWLKKRVIKIQNVIKGIADKEDLHLTEKEIHHEAVRTISHYLAKPLFEELCKELDLQVSSLISTTEENTHFGLVSKKRENPEPVTSKAPSSKRKTEKVKGGIMNFFAKKK